MNLPLFLRRGPKGLSWDGSKFIANFEGFVPHVYNDFGNTAIGFGHTIHTGPPTAADAKTTITHVEALGLLAKDCKPRAVTILTNTHAKLNQAQLDALISFSFNLGVGTYLGSTILQRLNQGLSVPEGAFTKFDHARDPKTGKLVELPGLKRRRQAEFALFSTGDYHNQYVKNP